jgi:hypothetical protein
MGTFIVRFLQLCFVGLLLAGMFMLGIFVFMLTAAVIVILGVVYWLRARGILNMPDGSTVEIHETHVYGEKDQHVTIIETDYQDVTPPEDEKPRITN